MAKQAAVATTADRKVSIDAKRGATTYWLDPDDIYIEEDPNKPLYDEPEPLNESLIADLDTRGNIQPISVCKNGPLTQIVVGRCRVRNFREVNRRRRAEGREPGLIKAIYENGTMAELQAIMLAENAHRKDPAVPSVQAAKIARSLRFGMSESDVAGAMRITVETVRNRLKLLSAHEDLQKAVDAGQIGETSARKLLTTLTRDEQKVALDEMVAAGTLRGAAGRKAVEKKTNGHAVRETGGRVMSRSQTNKWLEELAKSDHELANLVVAAVRYHSGDDEQLGGKWRGLRPSFHSDAGKGE